MTGNSIAIQNKSISLLDVFDVLTSLSAGYSSKIGCSVGYLEPCVIKIINYRYDSYDTT